MLPLIRWEFTIMLVMISNLLSSQVSDRVISLYDGAAPGSESWDWSEKEFQMDTSKFAYNIVKPTLTVYEADPEVKTGHAVIICPGGGFLFLAMEHEGYMVAKWLQEKGITAFVLKYRTVHCFTDNPIQEVMQQPDTAKSRSDMESVINMSVTDGKTAVAYVREHATAWGVNPDQIGIIGFSAGGMVATGVAFKYDKSSRPDFAAPIYPYIGSFGDPPVPADAPPLFIAGATDDEYGFQANCTKLYTQWTKAKKSAELHLFRNGRHGFGIRNQNLPTDHWIGLFYEWLINMNK